MAYCSLEVTVILRDVLFAQKVLVIFPNSALQYNIQNCVDVWRCQVRLEKMMYNLFGLQSMNNRGECKQPFWIRKPSLSKSGCGSPLNQCQEENYFPAPALISPSLSLNIYRTIMQQIQFDASVPFLKIERSISVTIILFRLEEDRCLHTVQSRCGRPSTLVELLSQNPSVSRASPSTSA